VFGEVHGTTETPAFIANLVCHAAQGGREVLVGLQIHSTLQGQVDRFLRSEGTADDVAAVLLGQFWEFQDGRSSRAMLALLDDLRRLTKAGKKVRVLLFEEVVADRNQLAAELASTLSTAIDESPRAVSLILVANLHARSDSERWLAWHLAKRFPRLKSLIQASAGGSTWVCGDSSCGPVPLSGKNRGNAQFIDFQPDLKRTGYSGLFYIGVATASPPAVAPGPRKLWTSLRGEAAQAYESKDYAACARIFLEAASTPSSRGGSNDLFNAACCRALAGDRDGALELLKKSIERGYADTEHIKVDQDLASLRAQPGWSSLVARVEANAKAVENSSNRELAALYSESQADRAKGLDSTALRSRDAVRTLRVAEILGAGEVRAPPDYFHAAMVLQHADEMEHCRLALRLAATALELDPGNETARWLVAATKDRILMKSGKPQLYGTQLVERDGKWTLYEVDPTVSDGDRRYWNVPPLAEAKHRAEKLNRR
jgi:hypothetical protein